MARTYSDTCPTTTLVGPGGGVASGLTNSGTAMELSSSIAGFLTPPFALGIEPGTPNEEIVLVTAGAGSSGSPYTIVRGQGTTGAIAHNTGVAVAHRIYSKDFADSKGVHGLSDNQKVSGSYVATTGGGGGISSTAEFILGTAFTIPANEMAIGSTYRQVCAAHYTWGAGTLTLRARLGGLTGAALWVSTAITPAGTADLRLEVEVFAISVGASGSIRACGTLDANSPANTRQYLLGVAQTVDTTVNEDLVMTGQWGTSNASNNLVAFHTYVERNY